MLFQRPAKRAPHSRIVQDGFADEALPFDHPVLRRFDAVWRMRAADGRVPSREDIDPAEIADLLGHVMLVEVVRMAGEEDLPRFRSVMVGQQHMSINGPSAAGGWLEGNPDETEELIEVVATGRPRYSRWRTDGTARSPREFERVAYPLSSDGMEIDFIASVVARRREPHRSRLHTMFSWL